MLVGTVQMQDSPLESKDGQEYVDIFDPNYHEEEVHDEIQHELNEDQ